jgi:hypothetical protein
VTQPAGAPTGGEPTGGDGGFKPITSQEEFNRIIEERVRRAKPADYDELKDKAAKWDKAEEANRSELEKAQAAAAEAEKKRVTAELVALRASVRADHGISKEDAELFLTGDTEEILVRQAKALVERTKSTRRNHVPGEGSTTGGRKSDPLREYARELFQNSSS